MSGNLRPGKGVHVELPDDLADWLADILYDVYNAFGTAATYMRPEEAAQELQSRLSSASWKYEVDAYGHKMIAAYEMGNGQELRVAVIVDKKGMLRLDIRTWFDPEDN